MEIVKTAAAVLVPAALTAYAGQQYLQSQFPDRIPDLAAVGLWVVTCLVAFLSITIYNRLKG